MPGYSQLQKLSEQILKLGNEIKIRAGNGERPKPFLVPDNIPDVDDSADFENGMPKSPEEIMAEEAEAKKAANAAELASHAAEVDANSFFNESQDFTKGADGMGYAGFGFDEEGNLENPPETGIPDIEAMMGGPGRPSAFSEGNTDFDIAQLLNPESVTQKKDIGEKSDPPINEKGEAFTGEKDEPSANEENEAFTGEKDDFVLAPFENEASAPPADEKNEENDPLINEKNEPLVNEKNEEGEQKKSLDNFDLPSFSADLDLDEIEVEEYSANENAVKKNDNDATFNADILEKNISAAEEEDFFIGAPEPAPQKKVVKILGAEDDFAILKPDIFTENAATSEDPPYYVKAEFGKFPEELKTQNDSLQENEKEIQNANSLEKADSDFDAEIEEYVGPKANEDFEFSGDLETLENEEKENTAQDILLDASADDTAEKTKDIFSDADFSENLANLENENDAQKNELPNDSDIFNANVTSENEFSKDDDFSALSFDSENGFPSFEEFGENQNSIDSSFDNFEIPEVASQLDSAKNDFDLESDEFNIPGTSNNDSTFATQKRQTEKNGAKSGSNFLSAEDYEKFKKNLRTYPLNVRIAAEDMLVKNEFTDEVAFELIDKVLKKVTARNLAGYLEKMLDISLQVPRDFERRTAEEFEAYKASFSYQLKTKILPFAIVALVSAMVLFCLGYLVHRYVIKPLKAEKLYKEGYALLEHDDYPQSEIKFAEAVECKPKKKWYYKYAQGYRERRQYERAEKFYRAILHFFDHDRQAGLEYAKMMIDDLGDYEKAEQILKREVLDYHINDLEGVLALGDVYLEWGTEKDFSKFSDAFDQYSFFSQLCGKKNTDLWQSRFLRYNIRTDQLRNVLELKNFFFPREKSLGAEDWTELSGYLMDKLYGELPRNEEYLRDKIEDLRDMMLFAIKADPQNPIANYNLSRYLVETADHTKALSSLKNTERLFNEAEVLKNRDVLKQLDNYRLLGEEYLGEREYILARETFSKGIGIFEKRERKSNFEGDKNVGAMYADMGDLEYFISGDMENARRNYRKAVENKADSPSVRYRIGYVDYSEGDYDGALNNFLKAFEDDSNDSHTLLALGNTVSLRGDNFVAQSYYERLLSHLDFQREKYGIEIPQIEKSAGDMVETYMKAANNLGVSQFRVSRQTGNSALNAKALVNFQNSIRYYDALTRNQETMTRLPGSNLAEQNLKYATHPISVFEPAIYPEIPRTLSGEKGLEQ